jgi:hypothetical protein
MNEDVGRVAISYEYLYLPNLADVCLSRHHMHSPGRLPQKSETPEGAPEVSGRWPKAHI